MTNHRLRLLYLGNAFPPGMAGENLVTADSFLTPHLSETRLAQELSRLAEVATVGLLPGKAGNGSGNPGMILPD